MVLDKKYIYNLVINELVNDKDIIFDINDKGEIIYWSNGNIPKPTVDDIQNKYNEIVLKNKIKNLEDQLFELCDVKSKGAELLIAQKVIEGYIKKEYDMVERALDNNDMDFFQAEAELMGTTPEEEFNKAKKTRELYIQTYEKYMRMIRAFRRKTIKLLENGQIDEVEAIINEGNKFDENTTIDDIRDLFNNIDNIKNKYKSNRLNMNIVDISKEIMIIDAIEEHIKEKTKNEEVKEDPDSLNEENNININSNEKIDDSNIPEKDNEEPELSNDTPDKNTFSEDSNDNTSDNSTNIELQDNSDTTDTTSNEDTEYNTSFTSLDDTSNDSNTSNDINTTTN